VYPYLHDFHFQDHLFRSWLHTFPLPDAILDTCNVSHLPLRVEVAFDGQHSARSEIPLEAYVVY
jgi:hypothetical protein